MCRVSKLQREVSSVLRAMGVQHLMESFTQDQLFSIDIALPQERIAIEVDGPSHFSCNTLRPLGEMHARVALLQARGWRVLSVPYFAWVGLEQGGQRAYLADGLAQVRAGTSLHPTTWRTPHVERAMEERPAVGTPAAMCGGAPSDATPTPPPTMAAPATI